MNYIEFTTNAEGSSVALKVGVAHADLFTEMEALRAYDGYGAARLIDADRDLAAILMERVHPGTMLWETGDEAAQTRHAGQVLRALPVRVPDRHTMPRLADQMARVIVQNRTAPQFIGLMPEALMVVAEDLLSRLLADADGEILLHGDLHHENILLDADVVGSPSIRKG